MLPSTPFVEGFDHPAPRFVLAIIDLAQIQNRTLHHPTACTAPAFDKAPEGWASINVGPLEWRAISVTLTSCLEIVSAIINCSCCRWSVSHSACSLNFSCTTGFTIQLA
jgi:hypothetical protein